MLDRKGVLMKRKNTMKPFKMRLKRWMKRHGVKPAYLADRCCMTVGAFRNYLSNTLIPKDKMELLEHIMKEFDVRDEKRIGERARWRCLSSSFMTRDYKKLCEVAAKDHMTPEEYVEELVALDVRNKWAILHQRRKVS